MPRLGYHSHRNGADTVGRGNQSLSSELPLAANLTRSGAVGEPRLLHWDNMSVMRSESAYSQTPWRQSPLHVGGYLSDGGVHAMASVQMVGGRVASVQAVTASFNPSLLGNTDTMSVNLSFARWSRRLNEHTRLAHSNARRDPCLCMEPQGNYLYTGTIS